MEIMEKSMQLSQNYQSRNLQIIYQIGGQK